MRSGPRHPQGERERALSRFVRLDQRLGAGAGLGLAIARRIAELHGGQLTLTEWADEQPGLCISISLPARPSCLQCAGLQEDRKKAAQKQRRDSRKTIKKLKAKVRRKVRGLAETTSLLVLSKKLEALYGEDPDNDEDN